MFELLSWIPYGLIAGGIAKWVHAGEENYGAGTTIALGVAGSYLGGLGNYLLTNTGSAFTSTGLVAGTLGSVAILYGMDFYKKWSES